MNEIEPVPPSQTFSSSRWTSGNLWFPDRVELNAEGVNFRKRKLIGGDEETIRYEQISSVSVEKRLFFADLLVETTGGSGDSVGAGVGVTMPGSASHVPAAEA